MTARPGDNNQRAEPFGWQEAFVKARGDGLGFELNRASFRFEEHSAHGMPPHHQAMVVVDGKPAPSWRFFQQPLGSDHWVTVARGPTTDVVDKVGEFSATLVRPTTSFSASEWHLELERESPSWEELRVEDLIPAAAWSRFLTLRESHSSQSVPPA